MVASSVIGLVIPAQSVWFTMHKLAITIGEGVTTHIRPIAGENPTPHGVKDRVDLAATRLLLFLSGVTGALFR